MKKLSITFVAAMLVFGITSFNAYAEYELYFGYDVSPYGHGEPRIDDFPNARATEEAFLGDIPTSALHTETFEDFTPAAVWPADDSIPTSPYSGSLPLDFGDAGTGTINDGLGIGYVGDPTVTFKGQGSFPILGNNFFAAQLGKDFSITFHTPQIAFGLYVNDVEGSPISLDFKTADGHITTVDLNNDLGLPVPLYNGSVFYIGIIDIDNPFVEVTFRATKSGMAADGFGFDHLSIATFDPTIPDIPDDDDDDDDVPVQPVPEPGTFILFGIGLFAGAAALRHKKQK